MVLAAPYAALSGGRDGTLEVSSHAPASLRAELISLLAAATGADGRPPESGTLRLPAGRGITMQMLPSGRPDSFDTGLVLVLIDGGPQWIPPLVVSAEPWQKWWGLTAAEARAAQLLAEFRPGAKVLAHGLGVSPATARTHLQRLFDKTGTHSQAALVMLLRQSTR